VTIALTATTFAVISSLRANVHASAAAFAAA
jgi:hypothetical protein